MQQILEHVADDYSSLKIEQKRVAVVDFGANERSGNSASSEVISSITKTWRSWISRKHDFEKVGL